MEKQIKFDLSDNAAKNYALILNDIVKVSQERNQAVSEVILEFIDDLRNISTDNYEKKVKEMKMTGYLPSAMIKSLISFLTKSIKTYKDKERREAIKNRRKQQEGLKACKQQELEDVWEKFKSTMECDVLQDNSSRIQELNTILRNVISGKNSEDGLSKKERTYIVKKLESLIEDTVEEDKKESTKKAKIEKTWQSICEIVDRESIGKDFTKSQYWMEIKDKILNQQRGENIGISINKSIKGEILDLIDGKIYEERELLYYNQVKYFTEDFTFFRDYPEVIRAQKGNRTRKFTDIQSYNRFYQLRSLVQRGKSEYSQIVMLLKEGKIDETSRKILNERMNVLNQQRNPRCSFEGR